MVKFIGKRRLFDEDADWVPAKGRIFALTRRVADKRVMKQPSVSADLDAESKPESLPSGSQTKGPKPPQVKAQRPITDAEGLDRAYADSSILYLDSQGTVHVAGTKGFF